MNLNRAITLALKLMEKHKLENWTLSLMNTKVCGGYCDYKEKAIAISRVWISKLGEKEIKDTILHEIAHALLPANTRHSPEWKVLAKKLGARPKAVLPKKVWNIIIK